MLHTQLIQIIHYTNNETWSYYRSSHFSARVVGQYKSCLCWNGYQSKTDFKYKNGIVYFE